MNVEGEVYPMKLCIWLFVLEILVEGNWTFFASNKIVGQNYSFFLREESKSAKFVGYENHIWRLVFQGNNLHDGDVAHKVILPDVGDRWTHNLINLNMIVVIDC